MIRYREHMDVLLNVARRRGFNRFLYWSSSPRRTDKGQEVADAMHRRERGGRDQRSSHRVYKVYHRPPPSIRALFITDPPSESARGLTDGSMRAITHKHPEETLSVHPRPKRLFFRCPQAEKAAAEASRAAEPTPSQAAAASRFFRILSTSCWSKSKKRTSTRRDCSCSMEPVWREKEIVSGFFGRGGSTRPRARRIKKTPLAVSV